MSCSKPAYGARHNTSLYATIVYNLLLIIHKSFSHKTTLVGLIFHLKQAVMC
jgi:hypothetical protein